jgi:DNA-binding CsgD family transcriptional regulator
MKDPLKTRANDENVDSGTKTSVSLLTDRSLDMCLPLGPSFSFVFHLEELFFLECEDSFGTLNSKEEMDWRGKSLFFLFDTFALPAHLRGARMLFLKGMELLKKEDAGSVSFQLQFDLTDDNSASKHILLQCCNIGKDNKSKAPLGIGRITDIHHLSMDAGPSLTVIRDNRIAYSMKAAPDIAPPGHAFSLSPRELEVLKLKSNGLSTREIALNLRRSPLTVYSVIRDIKKKTGMEIIPLIKSLFDEGKLN